MNETNEIVPATGYAIIGTHLVLDVLLVLMVLQYHRRRNYQPIRSRVYWQGEVIAVLIIISTFYAACMSEFYNYVSCDILLFLFVVFFNSTAPILMRAAHVFSAYEVSKVYIQSGASNEERKVLARGNFFLRRAELLQSTVFQAGVFCLMASFNLITYLVYTQVFHPTCESWDVIIWLLILGGGLTGPTLYLGWNMATLKDGLYIKREFILVPAGGFFLLPAYIGLLIATGDYFYSNAVAAFAPFWVPLVQVGMPLYKSYVWQRYRNASELEEPSKELSLTGYRTEEKKSRGGSFTVEISKEEENPRHFRGPSSLMKLLDSEIGNALFLEFARLELNHENVLFYNEATGFLEKCKSNPEVVDSEEFEDKCWKLFHKYISSQSRLELNLGAKERAFFDKAGFEEGEGHLDNRKALLALEVAWTEAINLMYRDALPRFVRSKAYEEYQSNAKLISI